VSHVSESRIARLAHLVLDGMLAADLAEVRNPPAFLREARRVMADFFNHESILDEIVRRKIQSLARSVPPGSREWDILYRKYREEELKKHKNRS